MLLQPAGRGSGGGYKIPGIGGNTHLPEFFDIIRNTFGGIVGDEDKLSAPLFDFPEKFRGSGQQGVSKSNGTVNIEEKELF